MCILWRGLRSIGGAIDPETRVERLLLLLKSSSAQQAALDELVEAQQDPNSPLYHQWLAPDEFGTRFGAGDEQLEQVTWWLTAQGFRVDEIAAGRRLVIFSGAAGQVFTAFRTELHRYRVDGGEHVANAEDPQIPAALAGVVEGVVSLHDFRRQSAIATRRPLDADPEYTAGSTHYLFPADFATIYDLNPLYGAETDGAGVSIAIAGRSNINLSDVAKFRATAGLAPNSPTLALAGPDPGLAGNDQEEATLDVEWSGVMAVASMRWVRRNWRSTTDCGSRRRARG